MAETFVKFDSKQIRDFLIKMKRKIRVPADLLRPIANIYAFKDIVDHFNKQRGDKGKWKKRSDFTQQYYQAIKIGAIAPPTGESRAQYNPANKILQMSGVLRGGFVGGTAKKRSRDSVIIRSTVGYSGKHDKGGFTDGIFGKRRLPARPFMYLSNNARKLMLKAILDSLLKGV